VATPDGLYDFRAIARDNAAPANSTTSTAVTSKRIDNTAPSATMNDPGTNLGGSSVPLTATASDSGSGMHDVQFQYAPHLSNVNNDVWVNISGCDPTSPSAGTTYNCSFDTTIAGAGGTALNGNYDFRVIAADNAGNTTPSTAVTNKLIDNTAPSVSITSTTQSPAAAAAGNVWIHNTGTGATTSMTLTATGSDASSGLAQLKFQNNSSDISGCSSTTSPLSCSFDTSTLAEGNYTIAAVAIDKAGNQASTSFTLHVDNTAPTGSSSSSANGGTPAKADTNDTITLTYSERIDPNTIISAWTGAAAQNITVRITDNAINHSDDQISFYDAANSTQITSLGTIDTNQDLVGNGVTAVFRHTNGQTANSTITQSAASFTITLGALASGSVNTSVAAAAQTWNLNSGAKDLAGNAIVTPATVTQPTGTGY
jgi:hypothetical protein